MKEVSADRKEPTAIPDNNRVLVGSLPPTFAILYTIKAVEMAQTIAINGTNGMDKLIARTAPNAAPEDIPIMYGSAMEFLNRVCIDVPDTDNAAPTKTPRKILGNRICKIIISSADEDALL